MLKGKNILLGVCGSIAAYKSATLIRLLVKAGANVKVILTRDAAGFITPLTLSTLSKNPVLSEYYDERTGQWTNHVDLGLWADFMIIAPASANTMAKMAAGLCDNLLTAVYLSAKCPVYFAPAMDLDMWKHKATQQNINQLISYGNILIAPASGELASGLVGEGRMQEPEDIFSFIDKALKKKLPLSGKKALVTAGPTYEAIDPVRFIGNHSSGKMGFAIAQELSTLGAEVQLVSGPTSLQSPAGTSRTDVTSAAEMLAAVKKHSRADIIVMSAAVADYRPVSVAPNKIKKNSPTFDIALEKTIDILAEIGKGKTAKQIVVGFALETDNELENAKLKLEKKNLDLIVLNSLKDSGAGFKGDTNKITIIDRKLNVSSYPLKSKEEAARDICSKILDLLKFG